MKKVHILSEREYKKIQKQLADYQKLKYNPTFVNTDHYVELLETRFIELNNRVDDYWVKVNNLEVKERNLNYEHTKLAFERLKINAVIEKIKNNFMLNFLFGDKF